MVGVTELTLSEQRYSTMLDDKERDGKLKQAAASVIQVWSGYLLNNIFIALFLGFFHLNIVVSLVCGALFCLYLVCNFEVS